MNKFIKPLFKFVRKEWFKLSLLLAVAIFLYIIGISGVQVCVEEKEYSLSRHFSINPNCGF